MEREGASDSLSTICVESAFITNDGSYIYVDKRKFFPDFSTDGNSAIVVVKNDLLQAEKEAMSVINLGKMILWQVDLGLETACAFLEDEAAFFSHGLTLQELDKKLFSPLREHTLGVSLYRGGVEFKDRFVMTAQYEQFFLEQREEKKALKEEDVLFFFSADVFIEYLVRLYAFLPEDMISFCFLDTSQIQSFAKKAFLLSRERFAHIFPVTETKEPLGLLQKEDISCGVVLPQTPSQLAIDALDRVVFFLNTKKIPFRVIDEFYLNECWDGVDDLVVLRDFLSKPGMRRLQGFLAAGGRVVTAGSFNQSMFGLSNEISLEDL